jgi:hypothetical protein
VGDTVADIEHNASGTPGAVQRQHGLNTDVEGRDVEHLKHELDHLLAVRLRVERCLSQQKGVLGRANAKRVMDHSSQNYYYNIEHFFNAIERYIQFFE